MIRCIEVPRAAVERAKRPWSRRGTWVAVLMHIDQPTGRERPILDRDLTDVVVSMIIEPRQAAQQEKAK